MVSSEKPMSIKNGEHGFRVMDLPEHNLSVSNIYIWMANNFWAALTDIYASNPLSKNFPLD